MLIIKGKGDSTTTLGIAEKLLEKMLKSKLERCIKDAGSFSGR